MSAAVHELAAAATRVAEEARRAGTSKTGEQGVWGEPDLSILTSHRAPAPTLPLDLFGGFWARYIADAAAEKSAPPDFVALPLISLVGAAIANVRRGSPWPGWSEPPVINTASVGKPSSGKSPGADVASELASALEQEWNLDFEERERRYRTARAEAEARREVWAREVKEAVARGNAPPVEPEAAKLPDPPEERRLVISDTSTQKAARLAAGNSRGLLLKRDELAGWLGGMDRYGGEGEDRAFWLEAYGGRPYTVDRVKETQPIRVPHLAIAISGGIQPDRLAAMLFAGADDGLATRFIYAWPERVAPVRPCVCADHNTALTHLRRLRDLPMVEKDGALTPMVVPFDEGAATAIQEWRVQVAAMEDTAEGLFCSWLGKLPGMALRLAVVFEHLWWCPSEGQAAPAAISGQAAIEAIAFLDSYVVPMARRTFGDAARDQQERDAAALARWLATQSPVPETVNARELRHVGILPQKSAARYDAALAELADADWLRPAPARHGDSKGRPRKDWAVNPKLQGAL